MDFDFKEYFRELQRRHVVKAGLAYLVGAWLLVQVLDILLDAFQLGPGWMQTTIIVLSVGFPIWLIIAWIYDFSPEGIKKTEDVPFDPEVSRKKNIGLNRFIIGGLGIAVVFLIATAIFTPLYVNYIKYPVLFLIPLVSVAALLGVKYFLTQQAYFKAWFSSAATIVFCTFFGVIGLFPNLFRPASIRHTA